jgi:4-hydroxy-2-oxoheptanedioate aldolase
MTDLPRNPFKAALAEGRQQLGLWCSIADPSVAEMLAGCGYDWLLFDTEHSPMEALDVLAMLRAVAPYPVHPVVRPTALDPAQIKKLLDYGAQSIVVPYVQAADEARLAAASVAYAPDGIRGVSGLTRATRYGAIADYGRRARDEICLIVQVETPRGLDNIEAIAAVPGIDGIFVGPSDLATAMGHPGNHTHPDVRAACVEAVARIRAAGKPAGFLTPDQEFLAEIIAAGSLFTAVDIDLRLLRQGALDRVADWRRKLG